MKTARTVYLDILTELVKEESPVLYLEDFLYYYNKAISEYMKIRYEKFEMTQQLTDDMRVWKEVYTTDSLNIDIKDIGKSTDEIVEECNKSVANLCVERSVLNKTAKKCNSECISDSQEETIDCTDPITGEMQECYDLSLSESDKAQCLDYYHNRMQEECIQPFMKTCNEECLKPFLDACKEKELKRCIERKLSKYRHLLGCIVDVKMTQPIIMCDQLPGTVVRYKATRSTSDRNSGLVNNVYLDPKFYRPYYDIIGDSIRINIGDIDNNKIKIGIITIEYLRQPATVYLTEDEISADLDESQILEFPDDVAEEITKRALLLILERGASSRTQTNMGVNQTITDMGATAK